ncbi:MAG: amidohydrolase [Thermotogota bacterium]|nr:amidohydrolase [Thermotogota bacterium]
MNIKLKNGMVYDPKKGTFNKRDLVIKNSIISNSDDGAKTYDIGGYYVYPGFVDSHLHLISTGKRQLTPSLDHINSKEELNLFFRNYSTKDRITEIFNARGWDQDKLGFMPDRVYLDEFFPETPVILERRCGHVAVVSSAMIDRYNLKKFDGLDGTVISKGYLKERALIKTQDLITLSKEEINKFMNKGIDLLLGYGITHVHTDDFHGVELKTLLNTLSAQNRIKIFEKLNVPASSIEKIKHYTEYESEFLTIGSVKIFLDGSFGARTGALLEPYADDVENRGLFYYSERELNNILTLCEKEKLQLSIHIIGDRALELALNVLSNYPKSSLKHRLIHLQIASNKQISRIAEIGLIASIQPVFYISDNEMAKARLGKNRYREKAYPFKKMFESGVSLSLSTDSPVEDPNPFLNIIAADNFFDRKTILYLYMINGRKHGFSNDSGRLLTGEKADFFITKTDLLHASKIDLAETKAAITFVNGKPVHGSLP